MFWRILEWPTPPLSVKVRSGFRNGSNGSNVGTTNFTKRKEKALLVAQKTNQSIWNTIIDSSILVHTRGVPHKMSSLAASSVSEMGAGDAA